MAPPIYRMIFSSNQLLLSSKVFFNNGISFCTLFIKTLKLARKSWETLVCMQCDALTHYFLNPLRKNSEELRNFLSFSLEAIIGYFCHKQIDSIKSRSLKFDIQMPNWISRLILWVSTLA